MQSKIYKACFMIAIRYYVIHFFIFKQLNAVVRPASKGRTNVKGRGSTLFLEELGKEYRKYNYLYMKTIEVNVKSFPLDNQYEKESRNIAA